MALEVDSRGVPFYREVRITIPRQSGKTTLLLVVEVDRSLAWAGAQRCLYTAQGRQEARAKLEEQVDLLDRSPLRPLYRMRRQSGHESIRWRTGSTIGITASGKESGHGQTLDLAVIDEAFAQVDNRLEQAFRPAMVTRAAAQLWVVSTAGTDESTFLRDRVDDGRARVEADERAGVAYFEWSAEPDADPDDPATWWTCMPALGRTVSVETIAKDKAAMEAGEFQRAYLNMWVGGGAPVIDASTWAGLADPRSQPGRILAMGLDVTPSRDYGSIAVASRRPDGRIHVEVVDHRPGTEWIDRKSVV